MRRGSVTQSRRHGPRRKLELPRSGDSHTPLCTRMNIRICRDPRVCRCVYPSPAGRTDLSMSALPVSEVVRPNIQGSPPSGRLIGIENFGVVRAAMGVAVPDETPLFQLLDRDPRRVVLERILSSPIGPDDGKPEPVVPPKEEGRRPKPAHRRSDVPHDLTVPSKDDKAVTERLQSRIACMATRHAEDASRSTGALRTHSLTPTRPDQPIGQVTMGNW